MDTTSGVSEVSLDILDPSVPTESVDAELLELLGFNDGQENKKEDIIHKNVAEIWSKILAEGLVEETKKDLVAKYPFFSNLPLMAPPQINREVRPTLSEASVTRDQRIATVQGRLGASLSAMGRALNVLLAEQTRSGISKELIGLISDAARLVADVHHEQSHTRRLMLRGNLNKTLAETLTESPVSSQIFGDNLDDRIKAAKALEKTTDELRAKLAGPSKTTSSEPKKKPSLNLKGPSRKPFRQTQRGGPYQTHPQKRHRPQNTKRQYQEKSRTRRSPHRR